MSGKSRSRSHIITSSLTSFGLIVLPSVSDIHRRKGTYSLASVKESITGSDTALTSADFNAGLPVVAFTFSQEFKKDYPHIEQQSISTLLRVKQYIVPSKSPSLFHHPPTSPIQCLTPSPNQTTPSHPTKRRSRSSAW